MTDTNYRDVTVSSKVCLVCGALVADRERHDVWHVDRQPAPGPDPWDEAIDDTGIPSDRRGWDRHMSRALRSVATAMEGDEDVDYYRNCLAVAAANVRAMAPEGVEWEKPWPVTPDNIRFVLRATVRALLSADTDYANPHGDPELALTRTESYLHGLWIAAKEGME